PEIQALPRHPNDKTRDVVLGHEVLHTRRQKQRLIDVTGAKVLAHSPSLNQTRWDLNSDYSDGLLADGNRVHVEPLGCMIEFGGRWRSDTDSVSCGSRSGRGPRAP